MLPDTTSTDRPYAIDGVLFRAVRLPFSLTYPQSKSFPFTDVPASWEASGCPRSIVIAKGDLDRAAAIVKAGLADGTGQ